jgi:hypothetical protein
MGEGSRIPDRRDYVEKKLQKTHKIPLFCCQILSCVIVGKTTKSGRQGLPAK